MSAKSASPTSLLAQYQSAVARIDARPGRERLALFGAVVAILLALEFLFVQPIEERRQVIERATVEQAQRQADEVTQAEQDRVQKQTELETQLARVDRELAQLGAGSSGSQSLRFLLAQALARQDVRIVSLRELTVEDIQPVAEALPDPSGAPVATAAKLYRHRFDVTLGGQHEALIDALHALDQSARPLRIERVRMSGSDTSSVQLAVTLVVIGTERAWLSI